MGAGLLNIGPDMPDGMDGDEGIPSTYGEYVADQIEMPQYRRLFISISRMMRVTTVVGNSWRSNSRSQALSELTEVMKKLHEIETEAEKIEDAMVREHVIDLVGMISEMRRSIAEEIRWDVEAAKADETAI